MKIAICPKKFQLNKECFEFGGYGIEQTIAH